MTARLVTCQLCDKPGGTLHAASEIRGDRRAYVHRECGIKALRERAAEMGSLEEIAVHRLTERGVVTA